MKQHHAYRFQLVACVAAFRTLAGWACGILLLPLKNLNGSKSGKPASTMWTLIRAATFFIPLVFSANLNAQSLPSCSDWKIVVCEDPLPFNNSVYQDPGCPEDCYRVLYHFYLERVGNQHDLQTEQPFVFTNLTLVGNLAVEVNPAGLSVIGPNGLSEVNVPRTEQCAPAFPGLNNPGIPNSPLFSYNPQTNQFSYQVSSNDPGQPILSWPVFGRIPLFSMVVDAFPDETVWLVSMAYTFELADPNGINPPLLCNGTPDICTNPFELLKVIPQPSQTCNNPGVPTFRLGTPIDDPLPGMPMRKKVPVWLFAPTSPNLSWDELDFLLTVAPSQYITNITGSSIPSVEGTPLIPASSTLTYSLNPVTNSQYRIYVHHKGNVSTQNNGVHQPNVGNTLFYIVFEGPKLESECAEIEVDFVDNYGRMDGGGFDCCKPMYGNEQLVTWDAPGCAAQPCPEVVLQAVHNTSSQGSSCSGLLAFDLKVSATTNVGLEEVRGVIKVKKTGTFALDAAATTSDYCDPNICIILTDMSPDYLRIEYYTDIPGGLNVQANTSKLLATIVLQTPDMGCIEAMTFLDAVVRKTNSNEYCVASWESTFSENTPTDDICSLGGIFKATAENEDGVPIEGWNYYVNYLDDNYLNCRYDGSTPSGTVSDCICFLPDKEQNVVLQKNNDYLNGVSTFDLVKINKHILTTEPLTGFKLLAADANMSGDVTTFDIVELRKLLLGIYTELPKSNSWRFIDKDLKAAVQNAADPFIIIHPNPDPLNPGGNPKPLPGNPPVHYNYFADEEFDEIALPATSNLDDLAEFVGFKVGDVNGNALPNFQGEPTDDRSANILKFGTRAVKGKAGEKLEIPVFSQSETTLTGWQTALAFDVAVVKVTGVRWPGENADAPPLNYGWHLPKPGELRLLWFDPAQPKQLEPGASLFFVQVELLRNVTQDKQLLELAENSIAPEAYSDDAGLYSLQLETSTLALKPVPEGREQKSMLPDFRISAYPNPSGGRFRLEIEASAAANAQLDIRDLFGRQLSLLQLNLQAGMNTVDATQLPVLQTGHYFVTLITPENTQTIRLIRR